MSNRDFRRSARFDFADHSTIGWYYGDCTGDAECATEAGHQTGCPKLSKDLILFKARRKEFESGRC